MNTTPERIANYRTRVDWCGCPDAYYRKRECKHVAALRKAIAMVQAAGYGAKKNYFGGLIEGELSQGGSVAHTQRAK